MDTGDWKSIQNDLDVAETKFRQAIEIFNGNMFFESGSSDSNSKLKLMNSLQDGYTALEKSIQHALSLTDERVPPTLNWAYDLLRRAASEIPNRRPAIISKRMQDLCFILVVFREYAAVNHEIFTREKGLSPIIASKELLLVMRDEFATYQNFSRTLQ